MPKNEREQYQEANRRIWTQFMFRRTERLGGLYRAFSGNKIKFTPQEVELMRRCSWSVYNDLANLVGPDLAYNWFKIQGFRLERITDDQRKSCLDVIDQTLLK